VGGARSRASPTGRIGGCGVGRPVGGGLGLVAGSVGLVVGDGDGGGVGFAGGFWREVIPC
jgi:hypothetical protein